MYKLLILILFLPYFAFSTDPSLPNETSTEAGAECVDCQVTSNSEKAQIEEQIEALQNR